MIICLPCYNGMVCYQPLFTSNIRDIGWQIKGSYICSSWKEIMDLFCIMFHCEVVTFIWVHFICAIKEIHKLIFNYGNVTGQGHMPLNWTVSLSQLCDRCMSYVYHSRDEIITMTSSWARWRLKSPTSRLFTQAFIQAQMKESIKAPRHWSLCGEFWIPRTNGQWRGKWTFDDVIMKIDGSSFLPSSVSHLFGDYWDVCFYYNVDNCIAKLYSWWHINGDRVTQE